MFAGSVSGDNFDIPRVPHDLLRPIQATAPAAPWLFPTPDIWQDKVVVETKGGDKYTAKDIKRMLTDLQLDQQVSCLLPTREIERRICAFWCDLRKAHGALSLLAAATILAALRQAENQTAKQMPICCVARVLQCLHLPG